MIKDIKTLDDLDRLTEKIEEFDNKKTEKPNNIIDFESLRNISFNNVDSDYFDNYIYEF